MAKSPSPTHETTDRFANRAHEAVDSAAETVKHAEERIRETTEQARVRSQDLISSVGEYVKDNPLTALGIAFAAGTIFSALTRRR